MDDDSAKSLALEHLRKRQSASIDLVRTELALGEVYGFDPSGWVIFAVAGAKCRLGATDLVAVNEETSEVRYLGWTGE